ncbi:MAG: hypothetical protein EZS28_023097, partial [Streblomastix strix]
EARRYTEQAQPPNEPDLDNTVPF